MKLEEYLQSLPQKIISGDNVQLPKHSFLDIFEFVGLNEDDVFYHLGCGDGTGIFIAEEDFHVKKTVGIDIDQEKIKLAKKMLQEKKLQSCYFVNQDVLDSTFDDATVILFWFTDINIIEKMLEKFKKLEKGCKIVTIWGPLPGLLPDKVNFPYIINQIPFREAGDLKEQILAVFDKNCIDFLTAWEYAERYTKAISLPQAGNDRFLTIIQSLVIWINAKNLGVACGEQMPPAIKNYIAILHNFFNIEVEHLLK